MLTLTSKAGIDRGLPVPGEWSVRDRCTIIGRRLWLYDASARQAAAKRYVAYQ